jgi:hypothetical protein
MTSQRLSMLVEQLWRSPIFGDSFQTIQEHHRDALQRQVFNLHPQVMATLEPIFTNALPELSSDEVLALVGQIAPKSTAFCAASAIDGCVDWEHVRGVVIVMAMIYWADQSMDRGDMTMVQAIHVLTGHAPIEQANAVIARRVAALQTIHHEIARLGREEDRRFLVHFALQDTLHREARMCELNHHYAHQAETAFWHDHLQAVVEHSSRNLGLICATALLYASYRQQTPSLPPLAEIVAEPVVMEVLEQIGNAAIRIFDDIGDRHIDAGKHPQWGCFALNILNQAHPALTDAFLRYASVDDPHTIALLQVAFTEQQYSAIAHYFVKLVQERFAAIPQPLQERYAVFLMLAKRIMEAGYVNVCGDIELAEPAAA